MFLVSSQAKAAFIARQKLGRLGTADEIASLFVYLASDEVRFKQLIQGMSVLWCVCVHHTHNITGAFSDVTSSGMCINAVCHQARFS